MDKEINQIKKVKTAGYLDAKDRDKIKIICLYHLKMRQQNNLPADTGHLSSKKIDSADFQNENLTAKTRLEKHIFFKKIFRENSI